MDKLMQGKAIIVTGAGSVGAGWGNGKAAAVLYARGRPGAGGGSQHRSGIGDPGDHPQ
jgi:NAD(P)-dependent dehydrogenase (short-subunit alcohol dehydrogenase family)